MGRLWQSLILSQWQSVFAQIPVESLIYEHQQAYYDAIKQSTQNADSAVFIEFMLEMISKALPASTPQVSQQVSPQVVELIRVLVGKMAREQIQATLGLRDRKSFTARYLKPALAAGLIETTRPNQPTGRLQKYRLSHKGALLLEINNEPTRCTIAPQRHPQSRLCRAVGPIRPAGSVQEERPRRLRL